MLRFDIKMTALILKIEILIVNICFLRLRQFDIVFFIEILNQVDKCRIMTFYHKVSRYFSEASYIYSMILRAYTLSQVS